MSLLSGVLFVVAVVLGAVGARWVWKQIPFDQCQRCHSYDVETNAEGFRCCNYCGNTWDPDDDEC